MNAQDSQRLLLTIDANVELLRRNLSQAERDVAGFERSATNSARNAESSFERLSSGGVRSFALLSGAIAGFGISGLLQVGRSVLQLADDLEAAASQAGVGVEQYQRLQESLRSLEVTGEQTDAILKRLTDTLGAVQGGTAVAGVTDALDKMGITARILNGEIDSSDELLLAIAESARGFKTEAEFTAAVVDILGRKIGVDFAAAVRDGGVALKELSAAQKDIVDEATLARLAEANERIDRLTSSVKRFLLLELGSAIKDFESLGEIFGRIGSEGLGPVYMEVSKRRQADEEQLRINSSAAALGLDFGLGKPKVSDRLPDIVVTARRGGGGGGGSSAPRRVSPPRRSSGGAPTLTSAQIRLNETADAGILQGADSQLADAQALLRTFLEIKDVTGQIENAQIVNPEAEAGARNIAGNLAQAIVYGQSIGDALVNSFKAAAAEALANGLFDLLLGGKGGNGGILGTVLAAFGGARANGGPVGRGKAYLVGERGPELFVPSASGMIRSNASLAGAAGGSVTFDLRGAVMTQDLLQQMNAIAARSAAGAVSVVADAYRQRSRAPLPMGRG